MSTFSSSTKYMPTIEERKAKAQRSQAWNGKQKHGSYARHRQVMQLAAEERDTFRTAEAAGEFVTVRRRKRGGKKRNNNNNNNNKHLAKVAPILDQGPSRFAAFLNSDDEREELPIITPPQQPTKPATKQVWFERPIVSPQAATAASAAGMEFIWTTTPEGAPVGMTPCVRETTPKPKRIGLKNGSLADECDSDDED